MLRSPQIPRSTFTNPVAYWAAVFLTLCAFSSISLAEESFPYTVAIEAAEVAVHSGPGAEFYETERLSSGSEVEVYRHVGDWCAIRPTAGSFSWVAAEHLEITDTPTLARVINVPVKTRVGSKFSDVHDVEYISLQLGEVVELLGTKMLATDDEDEPQRWFRVSPPAGEFRWIHKDALQPVAKPQSITNIRSMDADKTESIAITGIENAGQPVGTGVRESVRNQTGFVDITNSVRAVNYESDSDKLTSVVSPSTSIQNKASSLTAATGLANANSVKTSLTNATSNNARPVAPTLSNTTASQSINNTHVNPVTWQAVAAPTNILAAPEPRSFQGRYSALNVMLSQTVLEEIDDWQLDTVQQQAELLLEQSETAEQRQLTNSLLGKIAEFDKLRQRNLRLASHETSALPSVAVPQPLPDFQADANIRGVSDSSTVEEPRGPEMPKLVARPRTPMPAPNSKISVLPEGIDNSLFDATGKLIIVRSTRADMPRYALTDSAGQITKFIASSSATDTLRPYINQTVGIIGESGYLRKFNKPLVVASRIVRLER